LIKDIFNHDGNISHIDKYDESNIIEAEVIYNEDWLDQKTDMQFRRINRAIFKL